MLWKKIRLSCYQIIKQKIDFLDKRENRCHCCLPVIIVHIKAAKCRFEKCLIENVIESIMFTSPFQPLTGMQTVAAQSLTLLIYV